MGHPFERIAMELAGSFPMLRKGNRHIIVVTDYFSKWCEAYPVPTTDAPERAKVLLENCISHYRAPLEFHTDQRKNFESNLFSEMRKQQKINKTRATVLHPQSDGMVERFNRTILQNLSKFVNEHQEDWDHYIPLFMLAYRSLIHESTNHTRAKAIFGNEIRLSCDLEFGTSPEKPTPINKFVMEMRNRLRRSYTIVRNQLYLTLDRVKIRYDLGAKSTGFFFWRSCLVV